MGQFSWIDCKDGTQILDDVQEDVFLLIPKEFESEYGGSHIKESCYDGYGHFGKYDVYEVVADMNKGINSDILVEEFNGFKKPNLEDYGGLYPFEKEELLRSGLTSDDIEDEDKRRRMDAYKRAEFRQGRILNAYICFSRGDEAGAKELLGSQYKRKLGIALASNSKDNKRLKYPIKITHDKDAVYENCIFSPKDPNQGWAMENERDL